MNHIEDFFNQVSFISKKDLTCIYKVFKALSIKDAQDLVKIRCAIETTLYTDVLTAIEVGFRKEQIYFDVQKDSQHQLARIWGKCRFIVSSLDVLDSIQSLAQNSNGNDFVETIAIRIIPDETTTEHTIGIPIDQLTALSTKMRKLDNIAIRGIFIHPINEPYSPASRLQDYFSTVKNVRALLPCTFSYFCMEKISSKLSSLTDNSISNQLDTICLLNNTSLYSEFLIN